MILWLPSWVIRGYALTKSIEKDQKKSSAPSSKGCPWDENCRDHVAEGHSHRAGQRLEFSVLKEVLEAKAAMTQEPPGRYDFFENVPQEGFLTYTPLPTPD